MVLSANVTRNEWLWQTLDIGNMFGPSLASKIHNNFNFKIKITKKLTILLISISLHRGNLHCLILLHMWCTISQVIVMGASPLIENVTI